MCAPATRVRVCQGSINTRAIKIKRGASFPLLTFLRAVKILRKTHEPNRPLIEHLRGTKGKGAIIRVRELKLCDRERERRKNRQSCGRKRVREKIKSGFPRDQGNSRAAEEIDLI